MSRRFILSWLQGVLLLSIIPAYAEDVPTVVVSGTRSEQPVSVSPNVIVISREDIQSSGASNVVDVLRTRAGLQIADFYGDASLSSISMRGFAEHANSNVLIMVDGRRLNYSDTRAPDLSYIALQNVERIEVVQGSASVLFGDQAVAGVINIITREPDNEQAELELEAGSYRRQAARIFYQNTDGKVSYRLSASGFGTDNYRDHNQHSNTNVTGYVNYDYATGSIYADVQAVRDSLELPGALIQSEYDANRRQINAGFVNDFYNADTNIQRVGLKQVLTDNWSVEAELTNRETDAAVRQSFRDFPSPADGDTHRDLLAFTPRMVGVIPVVSGDMTVTLGVDSDNDQFAIYVPYDYYGPGYVRQSNDQESVSTYGQMIYPVTSSLTLNTGVRHAKTDSDIVESSSYTVPPANIHFEDSITVAELGLRHYLSESQSIYLEGKQNYRFPKVDEFVSAGTILKTQEGVSIETGYRVDDDNLGYGVDLYHMTLQNEFFFDPTIGLYGASVNIDDSMHQGVRLSLDRNFSSDTSLGFTYVYTNAEIRSGGLDGKKISGIAPNMATLNVVRKLGEQWRLYGEVAGLGKKYAQGDNANQGGELPGYAVLNTAVAYEFKRGFFKLRINNLLDKEYAEFVSDNGYLRAYQPSPERNFVFTAGVRF